MADGDAQERSEKATDQRLKKVRSDGGLQRSQDLSAWLGVGAAAVVLPVALVSGAQAGREQLTLVRRVVAAPDPDLALTVLSEGLGTVLSTLAPVLVATVVATLAAATLQGGIHRKKLKVSAKNLDLVAGMRRTFGGQAWWNGAKAALKTGVVALVLITTTQALAPVLLSAGGLPLSTLLGTASSGVSSLLRWAVVAGLALAAVDVLVIVRRNRKQTRMTKKEVKDEHKNTDGDPLLKSQRRSRQLAVSRNRMIAAIADADVVVVNPTHVAVALQYEPGRSAPRVVAKGAGHLAGRIREQAVLDGVPLVADVSLARTLHATCELGAEIPAELYDAVARVLAFVMALRRRGRPRPETVHVLPVPDRQTPPRPLHRSPL